MPKLKTKSSAKKRFKISATGKVIMAQGCKMITELKKEYPKANKSVLQKAQYEQKKFKCKS